MTEELMNHLHRTGMIAVLMIDDPADAVPVARALQAGGVDCMELTLRTPVAMEALRRIRAEVPEMVAGVGTILTPQQARDVKAADAAFGVSPGINPRVVAEAAQIGLPFAPGICTPSDIEQALEHGCKLLKFFPAEPCGGLNYLKNIAAPYAHLGLRYVPLGGVDPINAETYLRDPLIHAVGGSWLASRHALQRKAWDEVTLHARSASQIVTRLRGDKA